MNASFTPSNNPFNPVFVLLTEDDMILLLLVFCCVRGRTEKLETDVAVVVSRIVVEIFMVFVGCDENYLKNDGFVTRVEL